MRKHFPLLFILVLAFIVRLYGFTNPLADWHSWRQVDTSAVSREFAYNGFDIVHPQFHDLSNVPSGKENPQGYRFVEFPLFNIAQAGGYILFKIFSIEQWGRLITIFSSVLSTAFLYFIVKRHSDGTVAFFTAFFFAVMPFNIYFGRSVLPDPSMVTAILGGIFFFDLGIKEMSNVPDKVGIPNENYHRDKYQLPNVKFLVAMIFTAAALLLKPYAIFFVLPMVVLSYQRFGFSFVKKWQLWVFAIVAIIPLIWWRWWMMQYPEGIPVSDWLFNGGDIRFKGAFFYWLFADRLGRLILGYWGMGLFVIGLLFPPRGSAAHPRGEIAFFYSFLLSSLMYLMIIARGNVQHDYYQILIIPSICIFLGLGASFLLKPPKEFISPVISYLLLVICSAFMFGFGWYHVRDYYNINNRSIIAAGEAVDRLTPKDAKVIAPYDGDTTFLYYTQRKGWASFEHPIEEMVLLGATHLVLVNPQEKDLEFGERYKVMDYKKEYLLFDLKGDKGNKRD